MTLSEVKKGVRVRIKKIDAGQSLELRLIGMGLIRGAEIEMHRNDFSGPAVLLVRTSRIILGRGMLGKITVEEI